MDSISLVKELIKINSSIVEKSNEAIEFVASYLKNHGIEGNIIQNGEYKNYVAIIGSGNKTVVLNGHLDVVPGKQEQFNPVERNGLLYGRGSADMKAGCVAMIKAFIFLNSIQLPCKVMLQLVSDEENGGFNGSRYLVDEGYIGDFVICTEPTNFNIGIQAKGFMRIDIEVNGAACHGSRPWEGENAILKAIENYNKIMCLPIMKNGSEYYINSTVNLALIHGGDTYNKVPDKSYVGLDIRFVPQLDPYEIIRDIERVVDGNVSLKILGSGVNTSPDNPYVKQFIEVVKRFEGKPAIKLFGQHGSADTRFFSEKGIPVLEFGPIGANWHGDNEYVEINSIYRLEKILIGFIKSLE